MDRPSPSSPLKVLVLIGTRPEAVKLAPVVLAMAADSRFEAQVVSTGQHREMLAPIASAFGLEFSADLSTLRHGQSLSDLTGLMIRRLGGHVEGDPPDVLLVQGDTTSTLVGALVAHYHQIPCVHVEAGLRTNDLSNPFPEEANRRVTSTLTDLHLAPTETNRGHLLREGVSDESILVTGNTVIDALQIALEMPPDSPDATVIDLLSSSSPVLLVTSHRRESWGSEMREIALALRTIARRHPDWTVVFPMHRNPVVREAFAPALDGLANVELLEPAPYVSFVHLMRRANIILTDSGGVQEEAPSLGRPVLVMRDTTERPEAVSAGVAKLVGTKQDEIVRSVGELVSDPDAYRRMASAVNPYGDGESSPRVLEALLWRYRGAPRPTAFACA